MIEVRSLSIKAGEKSLTDGINFKAAEKETLGIIGESGSGKTVTALAIMGLLNPEVFEVSGSIRFMGRELIGMTERELCQMKLSKMSMVYQNPFNTFSPVERIGRQIDRIYRIKGIKKDYGKLESLLEEVYLSEEHLARYPHELSGGQLQRLVIASALLLEPELVIFDEPTTSLDSATGDKIISLIEKVREKRNMSIIFITHDLGIASKICDKILIMKSGKAVEYGETDIIINSPKEEYSKKLLEFLRSGL